MGISVDGWSVPDLATKIYAAGRQQKVALLIGNNSQEMQPRGTPGDIRQTIAQRYGPLADPAKAAYGVSGATIPSPILRTEQCCCSSPPTIHSAAARCRS